MSYSPAEPPQPDQGCLFGVGLGEGGHRTVHLPTSGRWFLTAEGIGEAAAALGFATLSQFVRAYPVSRQWLTLLLRRMNAVAGVYRLAATLSLGIRSRRSRVDY